MKKFLVSLLTIFLLFSFASIAQAETEYPPYSDPIPFKDLQKGNGASWDIMFLYKKGIIGGYPDGTFRPNEPITRAQASAMLLKALDIPVQENPTATFKDVSKSSTHYRTLATINEKGILRGDNGYMRPAEQTTRAQMAAILRRAFELPLEQKPMFRDVSPAHWAYGDINSAALNRIAGGYQNGTFKPGNPVTRAQFSSFLARAIDDKMKLPDPFSYVSQKGIVVEEDGFQYTIKGEKLVKINKKTKEETVLLTERDFPTQDGLWEVHLETGFPIILQNSMIYVPYWAAVHQMEDYPYAYGVFQTSTQGGKNNTKYTELEIDPANIRSIRNFNVYGHDYYYTVEKNIRYSYNSFDDSVNTDQTLILYHKSPFIADPVKVIEFDARVIFERLEGSTRFPTNVSQNNKSVKFDPSTMFYFNKKGVFSYGLLDGKTKKLSGIQAKDMKLTDTTVEIVDVNGKKHSWKK
ncbi:S-layer homology domain-containing protein [Sporosarcina sp. ACRSL]|uniref:S-layer homology domain-containing protein n=1 Tax=Sporosarcina sp. ACRSL TaxID=2918215 RepID=UPI001EF4AF35|nr:S-layer homology domain-containing protein [Sporosarcina sp. ACRSL]MCG7344890.1 S-layer homology domain-containing protein [Sporosarcina sp. ACRSL]